MEFRAAISDFGNDVQVAIVSRSGERKLYAKRAVIELVPSESGLIEDSFLHLTKNQGQSLMDALYEAGLKPSQLKTDDSTNSAMKHHLEDMRRLVFERKEYISDVNL